jgi:patatin-like phospholipase/acyl hydrolase
VKILAIDGGGIRGVFPAYIIKELNKHYNNKLHTKFDLIVGTSTGSILAGAIANKNDLDEIFNLYRHKGSLIFTKHKLGFLGLFFAKYDNKNLKKELDLLFKSKMKEISKPDLAITSSDLINTSVHVIKSNYLEEYIRDGERNLSDVILASCSAPTFFNPTKLDDSLLADGGIWANNPSLVGLTEAISKINKEMSEIKILSLGCGEIKNHYTHKSSFWGILTGYQRTKLVDYFMNINSNYIESTVGLLIKDNYLRINFQGSKLSLDDVGKTKDLISIAEDSWLKKKSAIIKFIDE